MKMLPEERLFRHRLKKLCGIANVDPKAMLRDLSALRRAIYEDAAKVAEEHATMFAEMAARAKAKGHNVDDIVARRISSEDIAAALRSRGEGK